MSTAGRVTAVIARVLPGQSGNLTFSITIPAGTPAGVLLNNATYQYDPGTGTPVGPFNSNTADFTVAQGASVTLTGQTVATAVQGGTVLFTNIVRNTGNGVDTFDITMAAGSFPAGSTFNLFQSDGNTPLIDSTGNGLPDTGPLTTNQTYAVIVRVTLPAGASGGGPYTAVKTARSRVDNTVFATANDVLTTIGASTVDLTANAALPGGVGVGPGPEGAAVVSNTTNPGTTTRFTLYVNNTSSSADSYTLAASTVASLIPVAIPASWAVVFRNAANAVIGATASIPAGGSQLVYVDVTVPAGSGPSTTDIYFRSLSPVTGASDTLHAAVTINATRNLVLSPNQTGTVSPGGTVVYTHTLFNNGNVVEGDAAGSSVNLTLVHSQPGWSAIIYYDADNDGLVSPTAPPVTDLSFVSAGAAGLAPGESVRLLVKVFAPPGAALGMIDALTVTATTVNGTYTSAASPPTAVVDASTVISGDVTLLKEQALDANLDGVPDGAYTTAQITTGAFPGRSIRYRITVTNVGTAPATSVKVFDTTPAFTTYTVTGPAGTTIGTVTTVPANGASGALQFDIGTLNPSQSAVITFGVIITP